MSDTIFALATARGAAGVAVVRVSGPAAFEAAEALVGSLPAPRHAALRRVRVGADVIDDALLLVFPDGESFTGEKTVEFQTHGSVSVVSALTRALADLPGLRPADAGEFTRRALENNRLDLAQVEGLGALISAETEAQRRLAFRVFDGALGALVERLRADIIRAAALIEATIDFADEDVPVDVSPEVSHLVVGVIDVLGREIAGAAIAERVRDGFEVAIVGAPNVGKSTLLNRLVRRDAAITSEIAGTTRDVIEVRMDLDGLPVTFLDTAGLRETDDEVERLGIARARERAAAADLRVFLVEAGDSVERDLVVAEDVVVQAKADVSGAGVSGLTGMGVEDLLSRVSGVLEKRVQLTATATHARHRLAMQAALVAMQAAADQLEHDASSGELVAVHLRDAAHALEVLIGRVDVEGLLGEIFSSFCIGK